MPRRSLEQILLSWVMRPADRDMLIRKREPTSKSRSNFISQGDRRLRILFLLALLASQVYAQGLNGSVTGIVVDPSGAVIHPCVPCAAYFGVKACFLAIACALQCRGVKRWVWGRHVFRGLAAEIACFAECIGSNFLDIVVLPADFADAILATVACAGCFKASPNRPPVPVPRGPGAPLP